MIEHTKCCRKNEWQFQVAHGKDIEKACQSVYLLHDVVFRKVETPKKPKFELGRLMELHGAGSSSGKSY